MPRNVDQEFVSVYVLGQCKSCQKHVDEILHVLELKVTLQELKIGNELLVLRNLKALQILLLQEFEDHCLLRIKLLLCQFLFLYLSGNDT